MKNNNYIQADPVITVCRCDSSVGDKCSLVDLFTTTSTAEDKGMFGRTTLYSA